ncbi:unnamed protein product, partial [Mesorhabditis belari]|uniref:Protein kinase domain-containing protein n=1 Tax=Mesorhabditis belari TaxID=2138241 RepID=A0AAF3FQH7_9BILA
MNLGVLVLERLANGSMERIVFSPDWIYSDHTIYRWCSNILKGLTYLHSINVIHADIKLSNLMLDSNFVAKIGDFDLSLLDEVSGRSEKTVGTDRTRAPELWIDNHVSRKIDVWSFGVVLWELIGRKWCFGQESYILIELSQKGKLEPPKFQFNHPLCDFITLCNIPSRIARPTSKIVFKFLLELIETESVNFMMRSFTPETCRDAVELIEEKDMMISMGLNLFPFFSY